MPASGGQKNASPNARGFMFWLNIGLKISAPF